MKEAYLYKKSRGKTVRCLNCAHYCLINSGKRGICGVRENQNGKLYSLVYGKAAAVHVDPIEKKPFFHFLPGSYSLSIATVGCNFSCKNCQNYDISQAPKMGKPIFGHDFSPEEIVKLAKKENLPSISYTYVEPTVFLEYALDTMKLAKKARIKNAWVTNGFLSKESLALVLPFLDAANVDIKGWSEKFYQSNCGAKLGSVLESVKIMKEAGVWVEITTLCIPSLSDSEKMLRGIAKFIKEELGPETPWHITQFSGTISWKLQTFPETPVETLRLGYQIGKEAGLKYVYTGNVPNLPSEDTFCPKCKALAIDRMGYTIHRYDKKGRCSKCGQNLNLILD